ncbi:kinase-like protein [Corynespora cassiicola Philippines]|uniref:Kinase-like protein n=1 Tax=Corynespora cassiicola Philippines TaxID=1448308 RepID=A0A2T2P569_CORCC|nr:kinase-like protein [Corynespora cassiicola Philippines]
MMDSSVRLATSLSPPDKAVLAHSRYKVLSLFQKILYHLEGHVNRYSLVRAQSLAEDVGIASGQLDRKLRHCSGLRAQVMKLLQNLDERASNAQSFALMKGFDDEIETLLNTTLHNLVVLLSTMKDPAPSDDIERLSQAVHEDTFTQFDIRRVQDKFPSCDPKLHRRIGALNRLRRFRIQDAQRAFDQRAIKEIEWEKEKQIALHMEMEPRLVDEDLRSLPMPQVPVHITLASGCDPICPFCMLNLNKGMSQAQWEEHVIDDIEPFMCTFGGCSQSYRTYSTREDWEHHENSIHRVSAAWICHDCDETSDSESSFKDHLRSAHSQIFEERYLDRIAKICKSIRPKHEPRRRCILCGEKMVNKQDEFNHLAVHLIDLALFVLPRVDNAGGNDKLMKDQEDSLSEIFEAPPMIQGLNWFKHFGKDDIIPFRPFRILGSGFNCLLQEAECIIGPSAGTTYVCKSYKFSKSRYQNGQLKVKIEAKILDRLRHVHIVSIVGAYLQKQTVILVLSPVFDRTLRDLLDLARDEGPSIPRKWFGCLASALAYLQKMGICHHNIKPTAIGIKKGRIILSSFHLARNCLDEDSSSKDEVQEPPPWYRPPDIFSLGRVFLEMLATFSTVNSKLRNMPSYGSDPATFKRIISDLEDIPIDVRPALEVSISMVSPSKYPRPSAEKVLESLIEGCIRMDTLHIVESSLVGKCAWAFMQENKDDFDAVLIRNLTLH